VKINDLHCVVADNHTLGASWAYAKANCSMPLLPAGRYNLSLDTQDPLNGGYGNANFFQPGNFIAPGTGFLALISASYVQINRTW
jgi:hypothetical protein